MKEKLKKIWKWLTCNVFTKDMILWVILAELIFWSPVIICAILAVICDPWWWTGVSAICLFWAGPFTPAVPLQIGLAVGLRKIFKRGKKN